MAATGYEGLLAYFGCGWVKRIYSQVEDGVMEMMKKTKNIGRDDPRRIIHSLKVGLAITLTSLFYYFQPLYDIFGASTILAVITIILVFEFSVGATLGNGLNRIIATLVGGALGYGTHFLAILCGDKGQPVLLGVIVFLVAAIATLMRFLPSIKARYDYGILIFIMTISMVAVSSYREDEIFKLASDRFLTIVIGTFISVSICIFVCPIWIGNDLHSLLVNNLQNLSIFLQEFGVQYFRLSTEEAGEMNEANMQKYRSILTSKQSEESMANLARWEPSHGKFRFRHPWKQYLKISCSARDCAYRLQVLDGYLGTTDRIKIPLQIEDQFKDEFLRMCSESAKALKELALAIKKMTSPASANPHIQRAKATAENLKSLLANNQFEGLEIVATGTLVSLLVDSFSCIEKVATSTQELTSLAKFKVTEPQSSATAAAVNQDLLNV